MADMSIAHYGTTLIEAMPPEDADQAAIPMSGDLARTDRFLTILGAQIYIRNMYPGVGRQFIYRRGDLDSPDYFEKDTFTSYIAEPLPDTDNPRVADTIFRITHEDPQGVANQLMDEGLIKPLSGFDEFRLGKHDRLWFTGPDRQQYELNASAPCPHENHRVYIWTDPADLDAHIAGYERHFAVQRQGSEPFYDRGTAHLLVREDPGMTIALVTPDTLALAPKHSFDIFRDAGYSHFRLASPDKAAARAVSEEAFPDGGGPVAYVHFQNAYLELVQIGESS
ncbi:MAG: hypothetical protein O3B72_00985 [Proteobacteria bacterium]|nr:hypothetical protein [Pseudomonadota bacterium]